MKYTFWGQPKFRHHGLGDTLIGYELFVRRWYQHQWQMPTNFSAIQPLTLATLLNKTCRQMPASIETLSFNLEPDQFVDPAYLNMVCAVQDQTAIHLVTELTERHVQGISAADLTQAARQFYRHHLAISLDDVGSGENEPQLVQVLDEYVEEYKFAFQNLRPFNEITEVKVPLDFWYGRAVRHQKKLSLEGLETKEEVAKVERQYPSDTLQGFYFGKPMQLSI